MLFLHFKNEAPLWSILSFVNRKSFLFIENNCISFTLQIRFTWLGANFSKFLKHQSLHLTPWWQCFFCKKTNKYWLFGCLCSQ